jgi:hypothetical protein
MIVLHVLSRSLAANCAETVLLRKHLVEVLGGYPVTASQMVIARTAVLFLVAPRYRVMAWFAIATVPRPL